MSEHLMSFGEPPAVAGDKPPPPPVEILEAGGGELEPFPLNALPAALAEMAPRRVRFPVEGPECFRQGGRYPALRRLRGF